MLVLITAYFYPNLLEYYNCYLLVFQLLYTNKILDKVDSTTFFVACSMAVVCLVTYVFMFINEKAISKKYSLEVEATVVDLDKNPNTKKDYYSPIYVYTVDGRECRVGLPYFINKNIIQKISIMLVSMILTRIQKLFMMKPMKAQPLLHWHKNR